MTLREEVEKLIAAEKARLAAGRQKAQEFHQQQKERMRPLTAALQEIVAALPGDHIKLEEIGALCRICVLSDPAKKFDEEMRFDIEPNWEPISLETRSGWKVKETLFCRFPEYEVIEREHKLNSEAEVCDLILPRLAREIARWV
jgi:hypothetical protein